jgi:hypothetical protein
VRNHERMNSKPDYRLFVLPAANDTLPARATIACLTKGEPYGEECRKRKQ